MTDVASAPVYNRIALIGLGLIASSMYWAIQRGGLAGEVTGYARSQATRDTARRIGLTDRVCDTAAEAVKGADLVVLAVPVGAMAAVAAEIAPHLAPGATVTDVGSVKRNVIESVGPHLPEGVHFIPAHPLAGTEHSGPESGFATLFDNRWCLLVPVDGTDPDATARLRTLWEGIGSNVEEMDADALSAPATATICSIISPAPARSGAALSRRARTPMHPTLAVRRGPKRHEGGADRCVGPLSGAVPDHDCGRASAEKIAAPDGTCCGCIG